MDLPDDLWYLFNLFSGVVRFGWAPCPRSPPPCPDPRPLAPDPRPLAPDPRPLASDIDFLLFSRVSGPQEPGDPKVQKY